MTPDPGKRAAVLGAVRRGLRRLPLPDQDAALSARIAAHPRHLIPARSRQARPELVAQFVRHVEREFGSVERVARLADVPAGVASYLAAQNLPARLVLAPHPTLAEMDWDAQPLVERRVGRAVGEDMASLQLAFAGIAETGTLMLPSGPDRPTTLNLLPDTAMVVLQASRIVGPYEDAWDMLRNGQKHGDGRFMPRNVMLVTGPSRSADIEQTLELGAHGPRRLHVLLVDDDGASSG